MGLVRAQPALVVLVLGLGVAGGLLLAASIWADWRFGVLGLCLAVIAAIPLAVGELARVRAHQLELAREALETCECDLIMPAGAEEKQVKALKKHLSYLAKAAHLELKKAGYIIEKEQVRANVFFPRRRTGSLHVPTELAMHTKSVVHDFSEDELGLTFLPGQGTVGTAFRDREARAAVAEKSKPEEAESWKGTRVDWDHPLTPAQRNAISRRLRWVLSIPICDPRTEIPLAVVCIDGLDVELLNIRKLTALSLKQAPRLATILACLLGFPQVKCAFTVSQRSIPEGGRSNK